jgi:hypothetical protein
MPQQEIIWTALPNGLRADASTQKLRLSVFVSPRLKATGRLGERSFADFHDWPNRLLAGVTFDVIVGTEPPKRCEVVSRPQPESAIWTGIFSSNTLVQEYTPQFDLAYQPISSYPAATVVTEISKGYVKLGGESPYRPAVGASLIEAFPAIHSAIAREEIAATQYIQDRSPDVDTMSAAELEALHVDLGHSLFRHDRAMSVARKFSAALNVAGKRARSRNGSGVIPLIPETDDPASAFEQFAAFHYRAPGAPRDSPPSLPEEWDFHRILSSLCEYPDLLRRLGLVIDLELPARDFPKSAFGGIKSLRVVPNFTTALAGITSPATKYLFDLAADDGPLPFPKFCAAPRQADEAAGRDALDHDLEIVGGLLNLNFPHPDDPTHRQSLYGLIQVDADGAGLKLLNTVKLVAADQEHPEQQPVDSGSEVGAPVLRTSGVSLVRSKLGATIAASFDQANAYETAMASDAPPEFWAENLVRGYRVDVLRLPPDFQAHNGGSNDRPVWRSLHKRVGKVTINPSGTNPLTREESAEGFIQLALVQDPNVTSATAGTSPVYVPESFFNWQGWALSAPPPIEPVQTSTVDAGASPPPMNGLPSVVPVFEPAPYSLPRLRFGHYYQFRLRTVDLAGNSVTVEAADDLLRALETRKSVIRPIKPNEFRYLRFDPVLAPALVLRDEPTEGESADVMVIRSNPADGMSAAAYATSLRDRKYQGVTERHVLPSKSAEATAEAHGLLDRAFGTNGDPGRLYNICKKETGSLNDDAVVNTATGVLEPLADVVLRDPFTGTQTRIPNGILPKQPAGSSAKYIIHFEENLRLPYLPDPCARGAALFHLPGVNGKNGYIDHGTLVYKGAGGQVILPPAASDQLGYVTKIDFGAAGDWPELHPFRLQLDEPSGTADQLPGWDPNARVLKVRLAPGETRTVSLSSYPAKEDVLLFGLYSWWSAPQEWGSSSAGAEILSAAQHGALGMLSPARKLMLVHAVQKPVALKAASDNKPLGIRRYLDDPIAYFSGTFRIHAASTAKIDLSATWKEPPQAGENPRTVKTHVLELPIHPEGVHATSAVIATYDDQNLQFLAPPAPPQPSTPAERAEFPARHDFGDTKHRQVTYKLVATTRFKEYFPDRITQDDSAISRSIDLIENVLSTAPPSAPEITSILPVFKWDDLLVTGRLKRRSRIGGGLRVYLGTNWHSSGEGEQLAVVEATEAGLDPIHITGSGDMLGTMKPTVPAINITGLQVYGFDVEYDKELSLWYSDITFDVGDSYFPFKQLKLVRYQKDSLENMHLSPIVDAGIHQLPPNRRVELDYRDLPGQRKISIIVFGSKPSAAQLPADSRGHVVEVTLEQRRVGPGMEDHEEDLSWTLDTTVLPVTESPPYPQSQLWVGYVLIPISDDPTAANIERRIVIREFELFPHNDDPPGQGWLNELNTSGQFSRRLVFADTIRVR